MHQHWAVFILDAGLLQMLPCQSARGSSATQFRAEGQAASSRLLREVPRVFRYSLRLQFFGNDVAGPLAHFGKNFGKVFTHQRHAEKLHRAQQQDYNNQ